MRYHIKVTINIPSAVQVYISGAAGVVNRRALCKELGLCNVTFSRLEAQHDFEYALNILLAKKQNYRIHMKRRAIWLAFFFKAILPFGGLKFVILVVYNDEIAL